MDDKDRVTVSCVDCGAQFEVSYGKYRRYKNGHEWRCKECRYKHHGDVLKEQWKDRSKEEKDNISKARSEGVKGHWASLSEEGRKEVGNKIGAAVKESWKSVSPEEYKDRISKFSESHKASWQAQSDERKLERIAMLRGSFDEWYNNLTDEQKIEYHQKQNESRSHNVLPINLKTRDENDATLWRYKRPDEIAQVKCEHCGNPFEIKVSSICTRYRNGTPNLCTECMKKWISLSNARRYQRMSNLDKHVHAQRTRYQLSIRTPEEWAEINKKNSEGLKRHWANVSEEENKRITEARIKGFHEWYNTLSDEEKSQRAKDRYASMSDENKQMFVDMMHKYNDSIPYEEKLKRVGHMNDVVKTFTPEQKADMYKRSHQWYHDLDDAGKSEYAAQKKEWWDNLPDSEKEAMANKQKEWWANLSENEKSLLLKRCGKWYDDLSDEEKKLYSDKHRERWNSLSDEEKEEISNKHKLWWENLPANDKEAFAQRQKDAYDDLPIMTKESLTRKKMLASIGHNKFHDKFERAFSESHLVNTHYIEPEYPTSNNGVTHCWDYAVFDKETKTLQMVVDLDGAYFHADDCDYDGIHSREHYDEKRALSIPNGINHCIIPEMRFKDAFEFMLKILMWDYDDYVAYVFRELRSQPFPYPSYSKVELLKSWEDLRRMKTDDKYHESISVNTRQGDRIIQHFHQSIWHDHRDGELSPYEAWKDDELLIKVIQNRIIYQTHLNPNKILQGFNIAKVAPKVSVFSAGRAKMIASRYLQDFNVVFDPFSGYSGRMLGVTSLGKTYIGQDISERHVAESNAIINFLKEYKVDIDATVTQKDIFKSSGEYPCLFTCSPYSTKEQWEEVPVDNRSCDDWIDVCLERFKCKRYIFVVDNTTKYTDCVVAEISNKSHFSNAKERIIVIDK